MGSIEKQSRKGKGGEQAGSGSEAPGNSSNPGSGGGGAGTLPPAPGSNAGGGSCSEQAPAIAPLRRLTRSQYENAIAQLFGSADGAKGLLPADDLSPDALFLPTSSLSVTGPWAEQALRSAEAVAKKALENLGELLPCPPNALDDACAAEFSRSFGKRVFRRPLGDDEVEEFVAVYKAGAAGRDGKHGIELVLQSMLQSPFFLYRVELGEPGAKAPAGTIRLSQHELAARLSFLLWDSMPDPALMAAADDGKLDSGEEIERQVRRMLADPRATATLVGLHRRMTGLDLLEEIDREPEQYPEFGPELVAAMNGEVDAFLEHTFGPGDGRLETLLGSTESFVDAQLAKIYGVTAPAGTGFAKVSLDPETRAGLLTMPGVLGAHTQTDTSAAIHRGRFVRERLLCTTPPDPPPDFMIVPPEPKPGLSARETLAQHTEQPSCSACHTLMDPLGFGFEQYDGIGRFRTTDAGKPLTGAGEVTSTSDIDGPFSGAVELSKKLMGSRDVQDCMVRTVMQFAHGPEAGVDACALDQLRAAYQAADHDVREVLVGLARTQGFRFRKALPQEISP